MVKELILRLCLPRCSSESPSVRSLWWMPTNLSWDNCDLRIEWRLPHIKEHPGIHLEIILLWIHRVSLILYCSRLNGNPRWLRGAMSSKLCTQTCVEVVSTNIEISVVWFLLCCLLICICKNDRSSWTVSCLMTHTLALSECWDESKVVL